MAGYWKNPDATAATVRNGWLHTGDMGYVSEDDFLYVLGRFKSLLIASDGEKYSPEGMEERSSISRPSSTRSLSITTKVPSPGRSSYPIATPCAASSTPAISGRVERLRPPTSSVRRSTVTGPAALCRRISRAVASGGTGYRGRAIHRAKRTDQQYDENRPQQGGRVFPRPDRLPLYSGGKGVAKR